VAHPASFIARLPDPGDESRRGPIVWRATAGAEAFLDLAERIELDPWASLPNMELLKRTNKVFWGRVEAGGEPFFIKGHKVITSRQRVRSLFTPSKSRLEWRATWALREAGVATAEPVAVGELRRLGLLFGHLFASRWIEGLTLLDDFLDARQASSEAADFAALRRRMAGVLGAFLGRLHALGAVHRQPGNLFLVPAEPERLLILDCAHVSIMPTFTDRDRAWGFTLLDYWMRPSVTRWGADEGDYRAFLRAYLAADPRSAPRLAELARRVGRLLREPGEPRARRPRRSRAPAWA
jgi:hypothetical protein